MFPARSSYAPAPVISAPLLALGHALHAPSRPMGTAYKALGRRWRRLRLAEVLQLSMRARQTSSCLLPLAATNKQKPIPNGIGGLSGRF